MENKKVKIIFLVDNPNYEYWILVKNRKLKLINETIEKYFKDVIDYVITDKFDKNFIEKWNTLVFRIRSHKETRENEKKYIKAGCFSTYSEEREKSILENKNFKDQFLIYKENWLMPWNKVKTREEVEKVYNEVKWENWEAILKQYWLTKWAWVSKHLNLDSILEKIDFEKENAVLKFIPHDFSYRVIVLAWKVVRVLKIFTWTDFRSNALGQEKTRETIAISLDNVPEEIKIKAERWVIESWVLTAWVDFITDLRDGKNYLCEINSPFDWSLEYKWWKTEDVIKMILGELIKITKEKRARK